MPRAFKLELLSLELVQAPLILVCRYFAKYILSLALISPSSCFQRLNLQNLSLKSERLLMYLMPNSLEKRTILNHSALSEELYSCVRNHHRKIKIKSSFRKKILNKALFPVSWSNSVPHKLTDHCNKLQTEALINLYFRNCF